MYDFIYMDKQHEPIKRVLSKFTSKAKQKWVPKVTKASKLIEEKVLSMYKEKEESLPFLLTLRIIDKNLHNFMVESSATRSVIPHKIF